MKDRKWICPKCKKVLIESKGDANVEQLAEFTKCRDCKEKCC